MNLPRSTYYHKPRIVADDQALIDDIEAIIEEFSGYGYRRVTRELHRRGHPVNHKKVHRIMRERGLLRKPKHRWVRTTESNHGHRIYPNLIQNLAVTGPNQAWVADITYIDTVLCLEALQMALADRRPPEGIVHHSDRGLQYASHDYVEVLLQQGFRISMARKRNPYDNATAESFIKTLKNEEVYLWEYRPPVEFEELFCQTQNRCPTALTGTV